MSVTAVHGRDCSASVTYVWMHVFVLHEQLPHPRAPVGGSTSVVARRRTGAAGGSVEVPPLLGFECARGEVPCGTTPPYPFLKHRSGQTAYPI